MMQFMYTHASRPDTTISVSISEDSNLTEAIEAFSCFLLACGYILPGTIEYVEAPNAIH